MKMPAMTADDAKRFVGFSVTNATILAMASVDRGCQCEAYTDWFTYRRWRAQGHQVAKGEHGVKLTTYIQGYKIDEESGERVPSGQFPRPTTVFCRCQVKEA